MKLAQLVLGGIGRPGNAKVKRWLRGTEKDWNQSGDPCRRLYKNKGPRIDPDRVRYNERRYAARKPIVHEEES